MQDNTRAAATPTTVDPYKKRAFDQFVTFCAVGGMTVSDTGQITSMTLSEFCSAVGIDEKTTWRWKNQTSNWGELIRKRREEIVPWARESAAWNRMYMIGMTSLPTRRNPTTDKYEGALHYDQKAAVQALTTYLGHFGELKTPTQRQEVEHQLGNTWGDLLRQKKAVVEGEVVDEPTNQPG